MSKASHRLQLLYFPECPHWHVADERLREVAEPLGIPIEYRLVTTSEEADRVSFRGSPTILIDGVDPFAVGDEPIGLSCRICVGTVRATRTTDQSDDAECDQREDRQLEPDDLRPGPDVHRRPAVA